MNDTQDRKPIRQALQSIPFLADALDSRQLDGLAARSRIVHFPAGAILMAQGDFGSTMFGIVAGAVDVTYLDSQARERDVARLEPGSIVGEIALLTGERRTATVTAATMVEAVEVTKIALEQLIVQDPDIVDCFATTLADRHAALEKLEREHQSGLIEDFIMQIRHVFRSLFGGDEARRP